MLFDVPMQPIRNAPKGIWDDLNKGPQRRCIFKHWRLTIERLVPCFDQRLFCSPPPRKVLSAIYARVGYAKFLGGEHVQEVASWQFELLAKRLDGHNVGANEHGISVA